MAGRGVAVALAAFVGMFVPGAMSVAGADDPSVVGQFAAPFAPSPSSCTTSVPTKDCPAGATEVVLANGKVLYWNALEATENIQHNTVLEISGTAVNDQSRVMDLSGITPLWTTPTPADGGANPGGKPDPSNYLIPPLGTHPGSAYGDLFCSDQVQLADGTLIAAGGTDYYFDPGIPGTAMGISELQGLANARIFHPDSNTWTQTGNMNFGRWYPSLVTLPDGRVFVASGVGKLLKPVYPAQAPTDSGRNVIQTETYDPTAGKWTYNGSGADKSLPLFARLHLLPDGKVYFDSAGQVYNPQGEAYDEVTWNQTSVYDPAAKTWTDLGIPGIGTLTPGFRGSTFSIMLPLAPPYSKASFLAAGGILGVTPGTYLAQSTSAINTVDTSTGDAFSSTATSSLNNARWYPTGIALPDETVLAVSGASADEVVMPGSAFPVTQVEQFDPATGKWSALASAAHGRTYHNSALLLPDGRVLIGGHAPIPTGYGNVMTLPGGFSNNDRDPSFEIFSPPYLFRGPRPVITGLSDQSLDYGSTLTIHLDSSASNIKKVVLMRNTSITHLVDGDQRTVELPVTKVSGDNLDVSVPSNRAVLPPGPYHLFVDAGSSKGLIPSVSQQVFVGAPVPAWVQGQSVEGVSAAAAPTVLPNTSSSLPIGLWLFVLPTLALAMIGLTVAVKGSR